MMSTSIDKETTSTDSGMEWGSDLVVELLERLDIEYVSLLPGSTTRGIHDSLVNFTGSDGPKIILCNHEMITASLARGYARAAGKPMVAMVHNVVGLLNTEMTIFDAWCDRAPILVIGGTGPIDASRRRPRTDWTHTANIQGTLVRDFTKWDDQPTSLPAMTESLLRSYRIATTEPAGPVYVCIDVDLQESPIAGGFKIPDVERFRAPAAQGADPEALSEMARWLVSAELPVIVADRVGRSRQGFDALGDLADLVAAPVIDMGSWLNIPTPHPLDFLGMEEQLVSEADLLLGFDAPNLYSMTRSKADYTTRQSGAIAPADQKVATISLDELLHRGFSTEYNGLPAVDLPILANTESALPLLVEECRRLLGSSDRQRIEQRRRALVSRNQTLREMQRRALESETASSKLTEVVLLQAVWEAVKDEDFVFTATPSVLKMPRGVFELTHPEQFLAGGGGGAVGAAPGVALGAALALKDSGRLPVAIFGDGGFFGSIQALWTAAHYEIPSLWIVNNNRSYYNDEVHQEMMATYRDRPVENAWVGQRMENPQVDFASITRTFGLAAEGPITDPQDLSPALSRAVTAVKEGGLAVVDIWTENRGRP